MAFANTAKLPFDEFVSRVQNVCAWFVPLNPYEPDPKKGPVSILEIEDQNFSNEKGKENRRHLRKLKGWGRKRSGYQIGWGASCMC